MTFPPDTVNPAIERVIERLEANIAIAHANFGTLARVRRGKWHLTFYSGLASGLRDAINILREETK